MPWSRGRRGEEGYIHHVAAGGNTAANTSTHLSSSWILKDLLWKILSLPSSPSDLLQYKFLCTRSSGGRHPPVNTIRDHGGVAGYEGSCEIQLIQKCCGSKLMMEKFNQRSSEIQNGVFLETKYLTR